MVENAPNVFSSESGLQMTARFGQCSRSDCEGEAQTDVAAIAERQQDYDQKDGAGVGGHLPAGLACLKMRVYRSQRFLPVRHRPAQLSGTRLPGHFSAGFKRPESRCLHARLE